jgi:hypothetical protein
MLWGGYAISISYIKVTADVCRITTILRLYCMHAGITDMCRGGERLRLIFRKEKKVDKGDRRKEYMNEKAIGEY